MVFEMSQILDNQIESVLKANITLILPLTNFCDALMFVKNNATSFDIEILRKF